MSGVQQTSFIGDKETDSNKSNRNTGSVVAKKSSEVGAKNSKNASPLYQENTSMGEAAGAKKSFIEVPSFLRRKK